jgi:hypothetical protein
MAKPVLCEFWTFRHADGLRTRSLKLRGRSLQESKSLARFIEADAGELGTPEYDLVFNAGVLEHYSPSDQIQFLRAMKSRSKGLSAVLVPNAACYWYWLWRVRLGSNGQWQWGNEVPLTDLSGLFRSAGLEYLGSAYVGAQWSETFIQNCVGLNADVLNSILEVHRSSVIPEAMKAYLVADIGAVDGWSGNATVAVEELVFREEPDQAELRAALADALSLRLSSDRTVSILHNKLDQREKALEEAVHSAAEHELALERERAAAAERVSVMREHHLAAIGAASRQVNVNLPTL